MTGLKVISLFTGVGGLDFGFEAAGFETAVAVERDRVACRTLRLNRSWPILDEDIHDVSSERISEVSGLAAGEADVLIGGPPCQPFSKSGYWVTGDARRLSDQRADTLVAYLRVLCDLQPRAFLLENVHGLAYRGKDEGLRFLLDGIDLINKRTGSKYRPELRVVNMVEFGVPQVRERVFLVGSRDGRSFRFPKPTHGEGSGALECVRTAWDALGDLPQDTDEPGTVVGGKWGDLLPTIPEGQNYLWHTNRGGGSALFGWRTRYWSFLLKLAKNRPSWTIQAQPGSAIGPFHWRSRRLTVRELCRLQTFPDDLQFDCGRVEIQRMIGNAVPSLMAEILAWELRAQLLDAGDKPPGYRLMPPKRVPVPAPEPARELPEQYLSLIGNHPDHPGEGRGRRAAEQGALF